MNPYAGIWTIPFLLVSVGCAGTKTVLIHSEERNTTLVQSNTEVRTVRPAENGTEFSPEMLAEKLKNTRRKIAAGWMASTGVWIVCAEDVALGKGRSEMEALEMAEILAKKRIASFLSTSVTAKETLSQSISQNNNKHEIQEFFQSVQQLEVNRFLRGVMLLRQETRSGRLHTVFAATGRIMDASKQLERQLAALPPGVVRAAGFGLIRASRVDEAKQSAVHSALRNAVEQVMGTMVVGSSQLMDNVKVKSKLVSRTMGTVKEYRIESEGQTASNYHVVLNARIDEKTILDNYAALVRSMGNPGFYIKTVDPDLQSSLMDFLTELGFSVTDAEARAEFIVDADCRYLTVEDEHYGKGVQIDLHLKIVDKNTGTVCLNLKNKPRLTSAYSGSFHQLRQDSAYKAFKTIRKQLHGKLNRVVMDWVLNGRVVTVVFTKWNSNTLPADCLEQAIAWVPCVKVLSKRLDGGTLEFSCQYTGVTSDFEEFLRERLRKDLPPNLPRPITVKLDANRIEFTIP